MRIMSHSFRGIMKSPKSRPGRPNSQRLAYRQLENRRMLSADLDSARDLVLDGDFENLDSTAFISFIDGDDTNTQDIRIRNLSTSFSRVAELDTAATTIESLAQDLNLEAGGDFVISFDLRGRGLQPGDAADSNDVEVLLSGESLGVFSRITALAHDQYLCFCRSRRSST